MEQPNTTMLPNDFVRMVRQGLARRSEEARHRLNEDIESIRTDAGTRGLSRMDGGTAARVAKACEASARDWGQTAWNEIRSALDMAELPYTADLGPNLKSLLMEEVSFGHAVTQIEAVSVMMANPRAAQEVLGFVGTAVSGARARLEGEADSYALERKLRRVAVAQTQAPLRAKHQKFGILDAPNLYADDIMSSRGPLGTAVIYLDIDDFKVLNKRLTETRVDQIVLPVIHEVIRAHSAGIAMAYGEGGDEFKILMPNATAAFASEFAEAVRLAIEQATFADSTIKITASLGVAHVRASESAQDLALMANKAKDMAKESGKNRVESWPKT
jgi:diguanylate cyclase (GGDEF)-like protein